MLEQNIILFNLSSNLILADEGMTDVQARKRIAKLTFSKTTVDRVLIEKHKFGEVINGSSPKLILSTFEKLTMTQRDQIRKKVSEGHFWQCYQLELFDVCTNSFI